MIRRWKHPHWQMHLMGILQGFAEIADGIVTVGSLGFLSSGFEMEVSKRRALRFINMKKRGAL